MDVSEFTLKLILLLIPGGVASIIFEKLTIHKSWEPFKFVTYSIMFGGFTYFLAGLTIDKWLNFHYLNNFWTDLQSKSINYNFILEAVCVAIIIGLVSAGLDNYKIINKLGKRLRLTTKYGDENLYSYFLNAKNITEVYVRDLERNITFHGLIDSFSETDEIKEIVLRDVKVYDYTTSAWCYNLDKVYISKPKDNLVIEIPFLTQQHNQNGAETPTQAAVETT